MAIGERIRFLRNPRGMTQKNSGVKIGFTEKTAEVRSSAVLGEGSFSRVEQFFARGD